MDWDSIESNKQEPDDPEDGKGIPGRFTGEPDGGDEASRMDAVIIANQLLTKKIITVDNKKTECYPSSWIREKRGSSFLPTIQIL